MQRYIFLDLDDTVFQTRKKCPANAEQLATCAYLPTGVANSFATEKQQWLWQWLNAGFKVIPVTGRDADAFSRVDLSFQNEIVLNHGAVILNAQRQLNLNWMQHMQEHLSLCQSEFAELWHEIEAYCARHARFQPRLVIDFDVTWYGVIKHADKTEAHLRPLLETVIKPHPSICQGNLYWHLNGNNLAVLPRVLNKESAVRYLLQQYQQQGPVLSFAAGDSLSDAPFLALCDYAIIPKNTQLHQATFQPYSTQA